MSKAKYTSVFKQECVEAILHGEDSVDDIAEKHNFLDQKAIRNWINRYNTNKELKDYIPKQDAIWQTREEKQR